MVESWAECSEEAAIDSDEVWSRRVIARQRQINIGKNRPEYKRYIQQVTMEQRTLDHPRTPDFKARISKRQFDRELGIWRRQLHEFDASGSASDVTRSFKLSEADEIEQVGPRSTRSRRAVGRRIRPADEFGADIAADVAPEHVHHKKIDDFGNNHTLEGKSEVVKLKLAEQLSGLDEPMDVQPPEWWPLPLDGDVSVWDFNVSPDKPQSGWNGMDEVNFQTPPHTRTAPADWTPVKPPLVAPANLAALWPDFSSDGFDGTLEPKAPYEWMPDIPSTAEFAMMLQCCHDWSHSSQFQESVHDTLWQMNTPVEPSIDFNHDQKELDDIKANAQFPAVSEEEEEDDEILESPRTPRPIRTFQARSPNSKLLLSASSQQASLPVTPQPRCWVPETPSPGPRTSVHWGSLHAMHPAPLPPLVLAQSWES